MYTAMSFTCSTFSQHALNRKVTWLNLPKTYIHDRYKVIKHDRRQIICSEDALPHIKQNICALASLVPSTRLHAYSFNTTNTKPHCGNLSLNSRQRKRLTPH